MSGELNRILCIDDDEDVLAIVAMALETVGGFTVMLCSSGEEALGVAEEYNPDFVLLDYMMPGSNGPATLEALRKIPSLDDTPIVFMTARTRPDEIDSFLKAGASAVVTKPFNPMTLADEIREAWTNARRIDDVNQPAAS